MSLNASGHWPLPEASPAVGMAERIRSFDWSTTSLGDPATWPRALHAAVALMSEAIAPMAVYWGPELILLYNDPWSGLLGDKHPAALGQPARIVFSEIWTRIEPLFSWVLAGKGPREIRDELLPLKRGGDGREDAWFTFSLNPLRDDEGAIAGVFNLATETTDRVRTERELRDSEEFYRLASSAGCVGTWDLDLDTGESRLSPTMVELLGAPPGEQISRAVWEQAVSLEDRKRIDAAIARTATTGERFEAEFRIHDRHGRERWLRSRDGGVHVDAEGRRRIFGATIDVTSCKQAEEQARRSEAHLAEIFDRATVGLAEIDQSGRFVRVNDELCRLLGRPRGEVLGLSVADVTHPDDREASLDAAETVRLTSQAVTVDKRYVRPDGAILWAQVSLASIEPDPLRNGGSRILAVTVDLTARRAAESATRESVERYRALVTHLPGGAAFTLDRNLRFTAAEGEALRLLGCSSEDFIGKTVTEALGSTLAASLEPLLRRAFEGEPFEIEHALYDRQFLSRGGPLRDQSSTAVFVCSFDITRRLQAEQALREADRRKDEFLATLAHELRNPLAPLQNCIHLLNGGPIDRPAWRQPLEMMARQVKHLERLVNDLMDLGRIAAGKIELRHQVLALGALLRATAERSQPMIDMHGHELDLALPEREVFIRGDPDRLTQVFSNLLVNAAKYTEQGGRITVSLVANQSDAIVRVCDTGIGIPGGSIHHVFDLFSQVKAHQSQSEGGLGVGLSLVRTLVLLHGGSVSASSEGIGKGSTFTVRLPLEPVDKVEQPRHASGTDVSKAAGVKVLVADDNIDAAISLASILESHGHEVTVAHDGLDALRRAREFRPAVVILNLNMPLMSGVEAAQRIRRLPGMRAVRIIALTGRGTDLDRQETRAAGFHHHLVKPVDPDALSDLLKSEGHRAG